MMNKTVGWLDLSDYARPFVSNCNQSARKYFDQGLRLLLSYQHELAAKYFLDCLYRSPDCAFASSLLAFSHGPNYNFRGVAYYESSYSSEGDIDEEHYVFPSQVVADKYSQMAVLKVEELKRNKSINVEFQMESQTVSDVEESLIHAFRTLTCKPGMDPASAEEFKDKPFAAALKQSYDKFGDDPEVAYFYVSSLMTLHAWNLFEYPTGKPLSSDVPEILQILEKSLCLFPSHVGLCHMYVHVCEMSSFPERALHACQVLRTAFQDAGHLVHMPSHIDVLIGDYESCVQSNIAAIAADKKAMEFFEETAGCKSFYFGYIAHNYHMLVYGSTLGGFEKLATEYSIELNLLLNEALFTSRPDMAVYLESYSAMDVHVMVRFGRWHDILKLKFPKRKELMLFRSASLYFARSIAYANLYDIQAAKEEAKHYEALRIHPDTKYRVLHNNMVYDILEVDSAMIKGEIAYFEKKYDLAFFHLRQAVSAQDKLNYDEPWGKMQPIRHALGGLLVEQSHYEEAEEVFREDLKRHPKNPWSLQGLISILESDSVQPNATCCSSISRGLEKRIKRMTQRQKKIELDHLKYLLDEQRKCKWADFKIRSSCACCCKD